MNEKYCAHTEPSLYQIALMRISCWAYLTLFSVRRQKYQVPARLLYSTHTNSVALSPQANYTDCATATCRRNFSANFCG
jgi:hypothetical protein